MTSNTSGNKLFTRYEKRDKTMPTKLRTKTKQKSVRLKFPKNPNNPSPSGDPYFDNPKNIAALEEGIRQLKEGKVTIFKTDEELQNFFDNL
jgi:hypothetical protein